MWRISIRLGAEGTIIGLAAAAVLVFADATWPSVVLAGVAAAQTYGAIRLALALMSGSVNIRYLTAWNDRSGDVVEPPRAPSEPGIHANAMDAVDFRPLTTLIWSDTAATAYELYTIDSALVVLCAAAEEPTVALSRLSNGALLVTTSEVVPPSGRLVVNPIAATATPTTTATATATATAAGATIRDNHIAPPNTLVAEHRRAIGRLQSVGVEATVTTSAAVTDYLRREWESWEQLGPFIGSLLQVAPGRHPLSLEVPPPLMQLQDKIITAMTSTSTSTSTTTSTSSSNATSTPDTATETATATAPTTPVLATPVPSQAVPTDSVPTVPEPVASVPAGSEPQPLVERRGDARYQGDTPPAWTTRRRRSTDRPIGAPQ